MRITTRDTGATIRRYIAVANGPVIPQPYSTTGKKFRVERITIEYHLEGGIWVVRNSSGIAFHGTVLKKNGDDSKVDYSGWISHHAWQNRQIELPWLVEIVNRLRPTGIPAAFHGEFEVEL